VRVNWVLDLDPDPDPYMDGEHYVRLTRDYVTLAHKFKLQALVNIKTFVDDCLYILKMDQDGMESDPIELSEEIQ
jgi:hypothetical protein